MEQCSKYAPALCVIWHDYGYLLFFCFTYLHLSICQSEGNVWTGVWKTACKDVRFQYKYFIYDGESTTNEDGYEWLGTHGYAGNIINRFLNLSGKYRMILSRTTSPCFLTGFYTETLVFIGLY